MLVGTTQVAMFHENDCTISTITAKRLGIFNITF